MNIYSDKGNLNTCKLLIACCLEFSNKEVTVTEKKAEENVSGSLRNNLPVLQINQELSLFSSNAAARYLFGSEHEGELSTTIDEWMEWEAGQLQPLVHALCNYHSQHSRISNDLAASLQKLLAILEKTVQNNPQYLIGPDLTVVDITIWCSVYPLFCDNSPLKETVKTLTHISQWFQNIHQIAAVTKGLERVSGNVSWETIKTCFQSQTPTPLAGAATSKKPRQQVNTTESSSKPSGAESENVVTLPSVTPEEVQEAEHAWNAGRQMLSLPIERKHPILPEENERNVLITSALPYVNNVPHLGNIIGCVLSADVFARFCRLRNINTLYICGTDEYGTATETKAMEEGVTPQQICDKYNKLHTEIYEWFNIKFDYFGRTTTPQQTDIAQDIFWKLYNKGYILKDTIDQLLCENCNRFLADRFVEGICPFCAYEDARGDQCDKCGKLINSVELKEPRCKQCQKKPVVKTSEHLFMDLPKLQPLLEKHLDKNFETGIWTNNAKVITKSWIRDGLKPRCISRDLKWGTPVPLEGFTDKVFYVWYDAPIGYISITANYTDQWQKWWKKTSNVELFQFMAKDNVPFHSVIFPSSELGTGDDWTVVNNLSATEYLNYEDGKFSKSRGVGVFGNDAQDTGIPADVWRFYLLFVRPESQDSTFSWDDFVLKNNSELLNNLGNFINRALMFVSNNFQGSIPQMSLQQEDKELLALVTRELRSYIDNITNIKLRDGLRNILKISNYGNQYIQANKPWVKVKGTEEEKARSGTIIGLAANISCLLSVMLQPYLPAVSQTIQQQLNAPSECNILHDVFVAYLEPGHKIGKPSPLFQKIESCKIEELRKKFAGKQSTTRGATPSSPEDIDRLTKAVTEQGNVVRKLKTEKAEKSKIQEEVSKLLDLKKQLEKVQGGAKPAAGGGESNKAKDKGKGQGSKPQTGKPVAAAITNNDQTPSGKANPEVERLTKAVADQGNRVRDLKKSKDTDKYIIVDAIGKLLDLKKELASAQGLPAEALIEGGSSKKKGKKK